MVRRRAVQPDAEKIPQRQRVRRAPCDPALRVNAFKVPNEQKAEIDPGGQAGSAHRRRIEFGALPLDKVVEPVFA